MQSQLLVLYAQEPWVDHLRRTLANSTCMTLRDTRLSSYRTAYRVQSTTSNAN